MAAFDVFAQAKAVDAAIERTGVFFRTGMIATKTVKDADGLWQIADSGVASYTPGSGFSQAAPPSVSVFVRDSAGDASNAQPLVVIYDIPAAQKIDLPPIAKDILVATYGGVSVVENIASGKPVTVNVLDHVDRTDNDIVEASVLFYNATRPPNTLGRDIVFEGALWSGGTLLGYTSATVEGEDAWTLGPKDGEFTFTPASGFTDTPSILQYTVRDTVRLMSNAAKIVINGQIDAIEAALPALIAMDEDAYWQAFRDTVTSVDYDVSVVFAVADARIQLLLRTLVGRPVRGDLGERLSTAELGAIFSDWADAALDIGTPTDLVLDAVPGVDAPGIPLARLDAISRLTLRVRSGRNL